MTAYDNAGRIKISYTPQISYLLKGGTFTSGSAISAGIQDTTIFCPVACTITGWNIATEGGTGSCSIDVRVCLPASLPATSGNSICASNYPQVTSGVQNSDTVLSGWATAVPAGSWITLHLISSSTFSQIALQLTVAQAN